MIKNGLKQADAYRFCSQCSADRRCERPPRRFNCLCSAVPSLSPISTLPLGSSTTSNEDIRHCFRRRRLLSVLCRRRSSRRSSRGRSSDAGEGGGLGVTGGFCGWTPSVTPISSSSSSVSAMSPRYAAAQQSKTTELCP